MKYFAIKTVLGLLLFVGFISAANALTPFSHVYTYYNAAGSIVGEEVLFCQGQSYYAGTLNTPNYVFAEAPCTLPCQPVGYAGGSCGGPYTPKVPAIVPGTGVVQYVLPGAETITQACATPGTQCLGNGEQPNEPNFGFTWYPGTGGNNGT
jgi:hypothetical protein